MRPTANNNNNNNNNNKDTQKSDNTTKSSQELQEIDSKISPFGAVVIKTASNKPQIRQVVNANNVSAQTCWAGFVVLSRNSFHLLKE